MLKFLTTVAAALAVVFVTSVDVKAQNKQQVAAGATTPIAAVAPSTGSFKKALDAGMVCKGYFTIIGFGVAASGNGVLWLESIRDVPALFFKAGGAPAADYNPPTRDGYTSWDQVWLEESSAVTIRASRRASAVTWTLTPTPSGSFHLSGLGSTGTRSDGKLDCFNRQ